MADYRIDQLTAIDAVVTGDQLPIWDASLAVTRKATIAQILAGLPFVQGTWTPDLKFGGAAVGMTYSTRTGWYQRIGRLVYVHGYIFLTAKGSSTGAATIGGLPLTSENMAGNIAPMALRVAAATLTAAALQAYISLNATDITLETITNSGVSAAATEASFGNSTRLAFSGFYMVT